MSSDEQMANIGRWVTERVEANRQLAMLTQKIRDAASALHAAANALIPAMASQMRIGDGLKQVEHLMEIGDLAGLKKMLMEHQALTARILELSTTLRNAGAE
jgi:hypothetical protein